MKLATLQAGQFVETGGYYVKGDAGAARYLIKAAQAFDGYADHELVNGTVAVLQIDGGFSTLEQLGYSVSLENAHDIINTVAPLDIKIKAGDGFYYFSDTIVIPSNGITLTTETGEFSGCKFVASSSFDNTSQIVDTENFDYLKANNVKVTTPDGGGIGSPKTISILGIEFVGKYNASTLAAPLINEGIGVRIYGGYLRLNIKVSDVFNAGVLTYYPEGASGVAGNNNNVIHSNSEITVHTVNTGREGYIFDGPPDAILGDVICRDASSSNFGLEDVTPVDSVEYPGDTDKLCPAINIRKACHHTGFMNGFGTRNGWSTVISNNRFDSSGHVQVDSSDGGLFIDSGAWAQFASIEFHGITYGFITHGGALRPAILSKSVQGVICANVKGNIGGDWSSRPMIDIQGVGVTMVISIAPIFSDNPTNLGSMLTIEGQRHNVNMVSSSSLSGANNKPFVFGDLKNSTVSGNVHFVGNNVIADFTNMDGTADKTNRIAINGITPTGNIANTVTGIGQLTSSDLKNTNLTFRSTTEDKDYSTKSVGISGLVTISVGQQSTAVTHNYVGTPNIEDISIEFIPESTSTFMPTITDVRIQFITGFSITVTYILAGGTGNLQLRAKVNN